MTNTRRSFLKIGALAGAGSLLIPELAKAVIKEQTAMHVPKIKLKQEDVILLQGDSITDAGRDRKSDACNTLPMLGTGYSLFVAGQLLAKNPSKQLKIYNRGVGGNKVYQLRERWDAECIAFRPAVVSILIGVNDYWHTLGGGYKGTAKVYEDDYRSLLQYTQEQLPGVRFVIGEPFVLKGGTAITDSEWFPMFDQYRRIAKKLAEEFKAVFVPYQAGFDAAMKKAPTSYWAEDGVHPTLPGRQLMANLWLEATGLK